MCEVPLGITMPTESLQPVLAPKKEKQKKKQTKNEQQKAKKVIVKPG